MRALLIILGIALAVIGGAVFVSPIHETHGYNLSGPTPTGALGLDLPYSIGDSVQYNVSWTGAPDATVVQAWGCGTNSHACPGTHLLASVAGASGAFTLTLSPGKYFTLNATVPLHVTLVTLTEGADGLVGLPALVLGSLVMTYGWLSYPAGTAVPKGASRRLDYYLAAMMILLVVAGIIVGYLLNLGPLTGVAVESSFGLAVGLGFLDLGLIFHVFDIAYRDRSLAIRRGDEP